MTVSLCLPIFLLQWLSLPIFVVYRLIVTAYNLAWLIYDIHCHGRKLFIYLTYWTYTILNMYLICATTLSCIALHRALWKQKETASGPDKRSVAIEMGPLDDNYGTIDHESEAGERDALRFHHKIFWLLYIISANAGLLVTAGYWTLLYEDDEPIDANNITKHALNSVFMLIDTFLSSIPARLFHSVYPLLYTIIYLAFTVAYWQLGGTNLQENPYIYKLLDYDNIQPSTGCLVGFFLLVVQPILQLILFGLVKFRDHLRPAHKTG